LLCAIGGGLIWAKVVNRQRNKPTTPEYDDVYAHRASYVSVHSYAEIDVGSSYVMEENYAYVGNKPSYFSVQS
jgi:hypothetical protein